MTHPHLKECQTERAASYLTFGKVEIPGVPLGFSQCIELLDLEALFHGEYNGYVLGELLNYCSVNIAGFDENALRLRGKSAKSSGRSSP